MITSLLPVFDHMVVSTCDDILGMFDTDSVRISLPVKWGRERFQTIDVVKIILILNHYKMIVEIKYTYPSVKS